MSLRRNTLLNVTGAVVPLLVSLVTVPLYVELIGMDRYGVLMLVWIATGYLGFFDVGIGRALAQRVAKLGQSGPDRVAQTIRTGLVAAAGFGLLGGIFGFLFLHAFWSTYPDQFDDMADEVLRSLPLLVVLVPSVTVIAAIRGAFHGLRHFVALNLLQSATQILMHIVPLTVASVFLVDLPLLVGSMLCVNALAVAIALFFLRRSIPRMYEAGFAWSELRRLFSFGRWAAASAVVGPLMVVSDRFLISTFMGAAAAAVYTIPFQLTQRFTLLSGAFAAAAFPLMSSSTDPQGRCLAKDGQRVLSALLLTPLVVLVSFFSEFLQHWMGSDFAREAHHVGEILLIGFWFNSLASMPLSQLHGAGRSRVVAAIHLLQLPFYLLALYLVVRHLGLAAVAGVFALRVFIDYLALSAVAGSLRTALHFGIFPSALVIGAYGATLVFQDSAFALRLAVAMTFILAGAACAVAMAPEVACFLTNRTPGIKNAKKHGS